MDDQGVVAEVSDTTYLVEGIALAVGQDGPVRVGHLPPRVRRVPVTVGDVIVLVPDLESHEDSFNMRVSGLLQPLTSRSPRSVLEYLFSRWPGRLVLSKDRGG